MWRERHQKKYRKRKKTKFLLRKKSEILLILPVVHLAQINFYFV